jgi:archaellum biogenesis ATPase FlaH
VFALVRVPGEDFVYSASIDLFNKLDDYCDEQGMVESRPPFLIKGESGTGKSALLSNWLQRRERSLMRSRTGNSDQFIFWHAVGCSRQSMNVNVVIKRLIVELKTRFELSRPLPKQQERYSWELPRFLDLAAKRGKVIIVIDGLNRLVNNDGSEDSLAWLPLVFPPNVRVILSVTIPSTVRMKQVGNAVKAMRVMSKFNMAKEASAAQVAVMASTSTAGQESTVLSEERPTSAGVQSAMAALMTKKPFAAAAAVRATSPDTQASVASSSTAANPFLRALSFIGNEGEIKPSKKSRILAELDRRGIPFMQMTPLNKQLCRSLVESFIHKSVNSESASLATGPHIASYLNKNGPQKAGLFVAATKGAGNRASTMMVSSHPASAHSSAQDGSNEEVPGFLLFENQISALLNHGQGGTPLFLRLFLRCLQYAVSRGYSLWAVYEDWMRARSVPELLIRILRTLENNFARTRSSAQTACDKTIAAGGLPALKQLYSWHPAFQQPMETKPTTAASAAAVALDAEHNKGVTFANAKSPPHGMTPKQLRRMSTSTTGPGNFQSLLAGEAGDQVALATIAAAANESMAGGAAQVDDGAKQLSSEVRQNLGDQAWFSTEKDANLKLQKGIRNTEEATAAALGSIKLQAAEDNTDLLQALVKSIRQAHETAMAAAQFEEAGTKRVSHIYSLNQARSRNPLGSFDSVSEGADDSFEDDDCFDSDDDADSLVSLEERSVTSDHTVHSKTIKITQELIPPAMRSGGGANLNLTSPTGAQTNTGFNTATGESMVTSDPAAAAQKSAKSPFKALASSLVAGQQAGASAAAHPATPTNAGMTNVPFSPHGASTTTAASSFNAGPTVDPSEGLHLLPLYLRGGADTTGFGDILGIFFEVAPSRYFSVFFI